MATKQVSTQPGKEEEVPSIGISGSSSRKSSKNLGFFRKIFCCLQPRKGRQAIQDSRYDTSSMQSSLLTSLTIDEMVVENNKSKEVKLLAEVKEKYAKRKCLVIDLDETLVHSSFVPVQNADFTIPVEIEGVIHQVYVLKRPYLDEFLQHVGSLFECVLFTASLGKYADPVTNLLDKWDCFQHRLFRESCVFYKGSYVKDLSRLGRPLDNTIIIDNSPASYIFHPTHAVPIVSWFDDQGDTSLLELMSFFQRMAASPTTAVEFLKINNVKGEEMPDIFNESSEKRDSSIVHTSQQINTIITSVTSPTS